MRSRRSLAVVAAVVVAFALGYATRRGGERPAAAPLASPQPVLRTPCGQVLADRYVQHARPGRAGLGAHRPAADRAARRPVHELPDLGASTPRSRPTRAGASTASACACARSGKALLRSSAVVPHSPAVARRACSKGDRLLAVDGVQRARPHRHGARGAAGAAPRRRSSCVMRRKGGRAARRHGAPRHRAPARRARAQRRAKGACA